MTDAVHLPGRATARRRRGTDASDAAPVGRSTADDRTGASGEATDERTVDATAAATKPPLWKRLGSLLITLAVVGLSVYLWPSRFGGSTRLVIVSGESMEPTYDLGDIVVARDGMQADVGDIVVFAVPEGEAEGMLVIHRVLEVDDEGFFVTQGDNRDTPDQWKLTDDDIVGEPLLHIPKGAVAIRFLQQWWVLTILLSLLAVFLLWPSSDEDEDEDQDDERQRDDDPLGDDEAVDALADPVAVAGRTRVAVSDPIPAEEADHDPIVDPDRTAPIPVLAEAELLGLPDGMDIGSPRWSMPAADADGDRIADLDRSLALLGLDVDSWTVDDAERWVADDVDSWTVDDADRDESLDSRAMAEAEAWLDEQLTANR